MLDDTMWQREHGALTLQNRCASLPSKQAVRVAYWAVDQAEYAPEKTSHPVQLGKNQPTVLQSDIYVWHGHVQLGWFSLKMTQRGPASIIQQDSTGFQGAASDAWLPPVSIDMMVLRPHCNDAIVPLQLFQAQLLHQFSGMRSPLCFHDLALGTCRRSAPTSSAPSASWNQCFYRNQLWVQKLAREQQ